MPDDGTLGEYLDDWLERQLTQLQPRTWGSYRGIVCRYVLRHLGDVALTDLARGEVEAFYAHLLQRGGSGRRRLSKRTVAYTHAIVHKALEDAVRDGLLTANPCRGAVLPKADHAPGGETPCEITAWDAGQLRAFLAAITEHRHRDLFVVAAFTGLRRGELCGLRWCDVDLDRQVLQVGRSLTIDQRRVRLKEPKTSRARTLHLEATACAAFGRQRAWQDQRRADLGGGWRNAWDLVFTTGQRMGPGFHHRHRPLAGARLGQPQVP